MSTDYHFRQVESLLRWIHQFDEPRLKREPNRPMKVLALGLSRTGTESLKFALEKLGYNGVYHGLDIKGNQAMVWTQLWDAKTVPPTKKIGAVDFDKVIGNCEAVTDAPCCMFAKELVDAYPDAKVRLLCLFRTSSNG